MGTVVEWMIDADCRLSWIDAGPAGALFGVSEERILQHWDRLAVAADRPRLRLLAARAVYLREPLAIQTEVITAGEIVRVRAAMIPVWVRGSFAGFAGRTVPLGIRRPTAREILEVRALLGCEGLGEGLGAGG